MQSSVVLPSQPKINESCLLSTAYFPPVEYFAAIANSKKVIVEKCEMFQKQSYRTRCHIYSANGLLVLTLPVKRDIPVSRINNSEGGKTTHKQFIDKVQIDYSKPWILQHKRALEAAYMTTPFFEYYKDDIFAVLDSEEPFLFDLNQRLIVLFNELIGISTPMGFTSDWVECPPAGCSDLRAAIHPKSKEPNILERMQIIKPYYQVFSDKQGFIPNLSILDLLCNEGPNSISFLKR